MFSIDFAGFTDSSQYDFEGDGYCGAMKLCEAMAGQDGLGFHPDSRFDDKGLDKFGNALYYNKTATPPAPPYSPDEAENLRTRKQLCMGGDLPIASVETLFGDAAVTPVGLDPCCPVICDVFTRHELQKADGTRMGMPILYYKADPSKLEHDASALPITTRNIYDVWDNHDLTKDQDSASGEGLPHHDRTPAFSTATRRCRRRIL
jgi:hypothetical protein